jgi:hypothetical protein
MVVLGTSALLCSERHSVQFEHVRAILMDLSVYLGSVVVTPFLQLSSTKRASKP